MAADGFESSSSSTEKKDNAVKLECFIEVLMGEDSLEHNYETIRIKTNLDR